jgi:hypothetical protein
MRRRLATSQVVVSSLVQSGDALFRRGRQMRDMAIHAGEFA